MSVCETISAKIRKPVADAADAIAADENSNRNEILDAAVMQFAETPKKRRRSLIGRVREVRPIPYPRTGRGNRKNLNPQAA